MDPTARRLVIALLKSYSIPAEVDVRDNVTLPLDALERLLRALHGQHYHLHELSDGLLSGAPPARLYKYIDDRCDEFHQSFPTSEEALAIFKELEKANRNEDRSAATSLMAFLNSLMAHDAPETPDETKLN